LRELLRAIIYTTKMSKRVTKKCHERYSSHVPCELRCRADNSLFLLLAM
jgi:hypothetical protein